MFSEIKKDGIYLLQCEVVLKDRFDVEYRKMAWLPIQVISKKSSESIEFVWFPSPVNGVEICYASQIKEFSGA